MINEEEELFYIILLKRGRLNFFPFSLSQIMNQNKTSKWLKERPIKTKPNNFQNRMES